MKKILIIVTVALMLIGCATGPTRTRFNHYVMEQINRSADFAQSFEEAIQGVQILHFINHWNAHNYNEAMRLVIGTNKNYAVITTSIGTYLVHSGFEQATFIRYTLRPAGTIDVRQMYRDGVFNPGLTALTLISDIAGEATQIRLGPREDTQHLVFNHRDSTVINIYGEVFELTILYKERVYL